MAKVFQDQIPPAGGRKYQISANADGSSNITDITQYQQDGTPLTAEFLNGLQDGTYPVGKADKLTTARKIGSADFDGSADITLAQMGVSNPNLLDNSNFMSPVNQRNITQISNTANNAIYTLDRWLLWSAAGGAATLTVRSGYISVYVPANLAASLSQRLVKGVVPTSYAMVAYLTDGGTLIGTVDFSSTAYDTAILNFPVTNAEKTYQLKYVKLEGGNIATPYVPKGYGAELAECQRYYVRYSGTDASSNIAVGVGTTSATIVYVPLILPVCMRSVPTVGGTYSLSDTSSSLPVTGTTVKNLCANSLYLSVSTSSTVERGKAYMLYVPNGGYFWVSAEL